MQARYLPDAEFLVYVSDKGGTYDIWMMDKFGRGPRNLTKNPDSFAFMPIPSFDGKKIFFVSDRETGIFSKMFFYKIRI